MSGAKKKKAREVTAQSENVGSEKFEAPPPSLCFGNCDDQWRRRVFRFDNAMGHSRRGARWVLRTHLSEFILENRGTQ